MTIAALWDTWQDKSENKQIESCAMVVTEPNKFVANIRMHVILERSTLKCGCAPTIFGKATDLMRPAGEDLLQKRPVSRRVNSSKAPAEDPPRSKK